MKKIFLALFVFLGLSQSVEASVGHAYVSNYDSNSVSVIDISTNSVVKTIPVGSNPFISAVTLDGKDVYVVNFSTAPATVSVINTLSNSVVETITIAEGSFPSLVAIAPDGGTIYMSNWNSRQNPGLPSPIYIIDAPALTVKATISNGTIASESAVVRSDGAFAYILSGESNLLYVIDTSTNVVSTTIFIPGTDADVQNAFSGLQLYVPGYRASPNCFYIVNPFTQSVSNTIISGSFNGPSHPAPTPDEAFVYVCNVTSPNNTICRVNVDTYAVSSPVAVGNYPINILIVQPTAPSNVRGVQMLDQYIGQAEVYNNLIWNLPLYGVVPSSYWVYRDSSLTQLVGTTSGTNFIDHSRIPDQFYTYYIVSVAYNGDRSLPVSITVPPLAI